MNIGDLCADLAHERAELDRIVEGLDEGWGRPTPSPGWTVADQISHLAWFDDATRQAIEEPDAFRRHRAEVQSGVDDFVEGVRRGNAGRAGADLAEWLHTSTVALIGAAGRADPGVRVPWYGPDMSVASSITARIMETWAHGQDIVDALGVSRASTNGLSHVAFIGWRALPNSFVANGRRVPQEPVRVEVGDLVFGPAEAVDVVRGSLLDFCLVVTQRRHLADTDLVATGPVAGEWLTIAQAFAGPPGQGRAPRALP